MKNKRYLLSFFSCTLLIGSEDFFDLKQDDSTVDDVERRDNNNYHRPKRSRVDSELHRQKQDSLKKNNLLSKNQANSIHLSGPDVFSSKTIIKDSSVPQNHETVEAVDDMYQIDRDFEENLKLDQNFQQSEFFTSSERKDMLNFVEDVSIDQNALLKQKLSKSQIQIIKKVTDSYLDKFFKKLMKKSFKSFLKNIVKMIFAEVRSAEKKNQAITDRDMWVICKKIYDQKLKQQSARKNKYIQARRQKNVNHKAL